MENLQTPTRPTYFLPKHRLIIVMVLAHCLVALTQPKPTLQVMRQLNYYIAMLFSVGTGSLLFWLLQKVTMHLDTRYPWDRAFMGRLWWQLMIGVGGLMVLELLIMYIYFWTFNTSFAASGFMENEFWTVLFIAGMANAVYVSWYFYERYVKKPKEYPAEINVKLGKKIHRVAVEDIICVERKRDIGYIYTLAKRYPIPYRKEELEDILNPERFIRINRSVIYAVDVISGYSKEANALSVLILKPSIPVYTSLVGSRSGSKRIRQRFKEQQPDKAEKAG